LGVGVAYFGVLPFVLPYLLEWIPAWVQVQLRLSETLSIIVHLIFGFVIAFQFPMAALILVYIGLLTPQMLKQFRKIAIVSMAVVAAVLTPSPDPFSMLIMLLPMLFLYESSIWMSYLVIRRKRKEAAE
jgi:sec-independent protein translocase protein TatC